MNLKQISIIGSGWLGTPLAVKLLSQGYTVKSSTTSSNKTAELKKQGLTPYVFTLGNPDKDEVIPDFLNSSDIIIINFPPKRIPNIETVYVNQVSAILPYLNPKQNVLFISSTSVYQNNNNWVKEDMVVAPEKKSGEAVYAVEKLLRDTLKERLTILRFSGLIGYDRLPGRFLANKTNIANGKAPINVIHRDDCIGLINAIIKQNCWGEVINGSTDEHPLREDFYTLAAEKIGLTPPTFLKQENILFKKVCNTKSKTLLNYKYQHPDPLKLIA
ncbi:NAD(P)-dependent oxidoreductase [Flavivirga aquatica]|uniref:NAD(P)-dependent oxidoreductase n=1 Tax=Flavivirga aquatica TaxID=1849968 RepID=A0A1E5SJ36_9FLAO|nr:NAD(P)-binding domain-containing protein [Flavivirga aquatica]OEJ99139.1 NAD(P)-dependent oxidoreductase [Flavivirga aquatica]